MNLHDIEMLIADSEVNVELSLFPETKEEIMQFRNAFNLAKSKFGYTFLFRKMEGNRYIYKKIVEGNREGWMKRRKRFDLRK